MFAVPSPEIRELQLEALRLRFDALRPQVQLLDRLAERNGVPFRFVTYALYGMPMMIVSIAICHVYVWWRYF